MHCPEHWQKRFYKKHFHHLVRFRKSECSRIKDMLLFGKMKTEISLMFHSIAYIFYWLHILFNNSLPCLHNAHVSLIEKVWLKKCEICWHLFYDAFHFFKLHFSMTVFKQMLLSVLLLFLQMLVHSYFTRSLVLSWSTHLKNYGYHLIWKNKKCFIQFYSEIGKEKKKQNVQLDCIEHAERMQIKRIKQQTQKICLHKPLKWMNK